jgi:hypothetical protein
MYLCKCGKTYADPVAMTECELAGHPDPIEAVSRALGAETGVEDLLEAMTDAALIASVGVITSRDRVPFRALLNELVKRLAYYRAVALESPHGNRDAKPRHHQTAQGSDSE